METPTPTWDKGRGRASKSGVAGTPGLPYRRRATTEGVPARTHVRVHHPPYRTYVFPPVGVRVSPVSAGDRVLPYHCVRTGSTLPFEGIVKVVILEDAQRSVGKLHPPVHVSEENYLLTFLPVSPWCRTGISVSPSRTGSRVPSPHVRSRV